MLNEDFYNVNDLIGKSLIAKKNIDIYNLPLDKDPNKKKLWSVKPGEFVGVIDTYFNPKENRKSTWWGFFKIENGKKKFYYAEHGIGLYNVKALHDQGVLTIEEKIELEKEKNKTFNDYINEFIKNGGTFLKYAAIFGAGAIILNIILKNRRSNEGGNR